MARRGGSAAIVVSLLAVATGVLATGPPQDDDFMTGGGWIMKEHLSPEDSPDFKVTHGFVIYCDGSHGNLEINWDSGNRFHMTSIVDVGCWDDEEVDPGNGRPPDFDSMRGWGMGRYNNEDGWCVEWMFTDDGEPGWDDRMHVEVGTQIVGAGDARDCEGNEVLNAAGNLEGGNHAAHEKGMP
jgi:hypothetical protein